MSSRRSIPYKKEKKIIIKEKSKAHLINIEDITYLHCDCYLTTVHTISDEKITVAKLLKYFEEDLTNEGFVRINRNILVNCRHIKSYEKGGNRIITMNNKDQLKASRRGLVKLKINVIEDKEHFLY